MALRHTSHTNTLAHQKQINNRDYDEINDERREQDQAYC
jgi:hypothetical protein